MSVSMALAGSNKAFWNPGLIGSTLALWLDADDPSTFTYSSSNVVSEWRDKSGKGRHATQATVSSQPSRAGGVRNGRAAVQFANHRLNSAVAANTFTNSFHCTVVFARTGEYWCHTVVVRTVGNLGRPLDRYNDRFWFQGTNRASGFNIQNGTSTTIMSSVLGPNLMQEWVNGTQQYYSTGTFTITADTATTIQIGRRDNDECQLWGDLCEVVVTDTTLSTDNRQKLEGYLAHKWGVVASLPSNHPYKSLAP